MGSGAILRTHHILQQVQNLSSKFVTCNHELCKFKVIRFSTRGYEVNRKVLLRPNEPAPSTVPQLEFDHNHVNSIVKSKNWGPLEVCIN